ncbi:MAG: hypothetical protein HGA86_02105, partial [Anaerolineaceae bacterium]|nr:hypothetical protein [Anaerolineaceae bacterium]
MDKNEHLDLYNQMVVIRRMEEKAAELYQQGKIGGFLHLYIGQEAVSTALISARKPFPPGTNAESTAASWPYWYRTVCLAKSSRRVRRGLAAMIVGPFWAAFSSRSHQMGASWCRSQAMAKTTVSGPSMEKSVSTPGPIFETRSPPAM